MLCLVRIILFYSVVLGKHPHVYHVCAVAHRGQTESQVPLNWSYNCI